MDTINYYPSDTTIGGLLYSNYTSEEIRRLSVKELTSSQAIDRLGAPVSGGPYDLALGPFDKNDRCFTCGQGFVACPGHLGHISLVLPVYNPVFFRNLVNVLRGCCLHCHTIQCSNAEKYLFSMQMLYLKHGQTNEIDNLQSIYKMWVLERKSLDTFYEQINEHMKLNPPSSTKIESTTKNLLAIRQQLIKDFESRTFKSHKKFCPNCNTPSRSLRADSHTKLFYSQAVSNKQIKAYQQRMSNVRQKKKMDDDDDDDDDEVIDNTEEELVTKMMSGQMYLTPLDVLKHFEKIWANEKEVLGIYLATLRSSPHHSITNVYNNPISLFFFEVLPVLPSKFRPVLSFNDQKFENPKTVRYSSIIQDNQLIKELLLLKDKQTSDIPTSTHSRSSSLINTLRGATNEEKLNNLWLKMQITVNSIFDSSLDNRSGGRVAKGIRQVIEKKEGLFRMHMMGKRVNYAGRSVISPDPFIAIYEVGIPEIFAKKLTYPELVTPHNVHELRQLILNGPDVHPGANFVELEDGTIRRLLPNNLSQRTAVAKLLLTREKQHGNTTLMSTKKVYRHLRNGDYVLANRQPTLHRPSIQAHMARVLPGEKTLRLHYAQCKSYNADFDGDEMNIHLPQNELTRAEAAELMITYQHFLVSKDGTPLTGLIQDHVVAGTSLTMRDRFFEKADYQQLVYNSIGSNSRRKIQLLPPCIIKPKQLWSGKQIISTVLLYIQPAKESPLNLDSKSKLSMKSWPSKPGATNIDLMADTDVIIRQGHLLSGLIDKAHCGATLASVVHCYYELYGKRCAADLVSAFSKLFTLFLQYYRGFTLGIEDVLLLPPGVSYRRRLINECRAQAGRNALQKTFSTPDDSNEQVLMDEFAKAFCSKSFDERVSKEMDANYKTSIDEFQNQIIKQCMSNLFKHFPENNLQFLIQSGAKGSTVNAMQMSCLLGQQELEGKRPPMMPSGRTLPSFRPYEYSPRSGGFVDGSFLSGIRPQEYFFHCMAGREGLIDTAVKTARIGYLQRCLMKHLEGLVVNYDLTVRDSDGSVIQFQYGEDGLAVDKCTYLKEAYYPFLVANQSSILRENEYSRIVDKCGSTKERPIIKNLKKIRAWRKKTRELADDDSSLNDTTRLKISDETKIRMTPFINYSRFFDLNTLTNSLKSKDINEARSIMVQTWRDLPDDKREQYNHGVVKFYSPITQNYLPASNLGAITERLDDLIRNYMNTHGKLDQTKMDKKAFEKMLHFKSLKSCIDPGESVGILAAQSIGEPSTQMTLNTFHFAGRGEMNVTLGVPRLRELLMVASLNVKTPTMEVPILHSSSALRKAKRLQRRWSRLVFSQVLTNLNIHEKLSLKLNDHKRTYTIEFKFNENYGKKQLNEILRSFETYFIPRLCRAINKKRKELTTSGLLRSAHIRDKVTINNSNDKDDQQEAMEKDDDDDDDDDEQANGEANTAKEKSNRNDEKEYDDDDDNNNNEENGTDDEAPMHDNPDDNDQLTASKISIKQDIIDDDDDVQALDTFKEEANDNDEQEVPSNNNDDDEPPSKKARKSHEKTTKNGNNTYNERFGNVCKHADYIHEYTADLDNNLWCRLTMIFPATQPRIDLESLIRHEASRTTITSIVGIQNCFISENKEYRGKTKADSDDTEYILSTEGENINALMTYYQVFDLCRIYTNNIHRMAQIFGIEAANRTLIREINRVFGAYGIEVDYRHLSLLADYMTYEGVYKPCNRLGLRTNASPLQKITFETSTSYLKEALLHGEHEDLKSPSSRLVTGRMVKCGTGAFDVLTKLSS
ncbi:unnamed protein product [Adineta steineri]|uniref:DNA-directed RNA polymerase subunit n=1 Tax=Adineta steineri TaxID=433720 RepID=A0A814VCG6_9BILA|nr:unnamed protein product [Adineta steineri]CAF1553299.1 unnamed protein product [Adineta steineri]